MSPTPFPVDIIHAAQDSGWVIASAIGSLAVALVTGVLAIATVSLAKQSRKMAEETKISVSLADRAQQLRFTDTEILRMVEPEMRDALNLILVGRGNQEDRTYAKQMFDIGYNVPVRERPEPQQSYFRAVGLYDNLLDRISAYSEAGLIDEHLFFSQYDELILGLYFLLGDYIWEGNELSPRSRITKFATRAFLHFVEYAEVPWIGNDQLVFYEPKAREFYPSPKTEALLAQARATRDEVWYNVYSQPAKATRPD